MNFSFNIMKKTTLLSVSIFICTLAFAQNGNASADNAPGSVEQRYEAFEAYAKALGIIRYYSPNPYTLEWDEDSEYNWSRIAYADVKAMERGVSVEEVLRSLLAVMAPGASISSEPMPSSRRLNGSISEYSYVLHQGCGRINVPKLAKLLNKEIRNYRPFYSELVPCSEVGASGGTGQEKPEWNPMLPVVPSELPQPDSVYSYRLSQGLYLNIPHAERAGAFSKKATAQLLKSAEEQWEEAAESYGKQARAKSVGLIGEKAFRVSNAIIRWNLIQHFYPYHEEDGLQWEEHLRNMITAVDTLPEGPMDRDGVYEYYKAVRKSLKPVKDSHLITYHSFNINPITGFYLPLFYTPAEFEYLDGKVMLEGNEVLSINGVSVLRALEEARSRIASSSEVAALHEALGLLTETAEMNAPFVLELLEASGKVVVDTLYATAEQPLQPRSGSEQFARTVEDILVINPTLSMECYEQFVPWLDSMSQYRAVVFDVRGYPAYDFDKVFTHILDTTISTEFFYNPRSCFPNREHLYYAYEPESVHPAVPHIDIPVYFLADHRTMSWGETVLMLVKNFRLGTIIGSNTQGTNGDATEISLPVWMYRLTAIKTLNRDGSQFHGIGVIPDIRVEHPFTIDDILEVVRR